MLYLLVWVEVYYTECPRAMVDIKQSIRACFVPVARAVGTFIIPASFMHLFTVRLNDN